MKNKNKMLLLLGVALFSAPALSGCSSSSSGLTLHVLNCEDYIGDSVVDEFEAYYLKTYGQAIDVIYDTYDTNETMLSSLKTGKSNYDLICCSDYAIQKMMAQNMLIPFSLDDSGKYSNLPNYSQYCSKYLLDVMDNLEGSVDDGTGNKIATPLSHYSAGYMWGTLGILYNPEKVASDKGMEVDEVKYDMSSWNSLWDDKYQGEMSIKDSMRDTYSVGIMSVFDEEIKADMASSGDFDASTLELLDGHYNHAVSEYNPKISEIFNRCDQESVNKVQDSLLSLKKNVFGFEVDSGKDDIVKGLVGMNLAWSGDAVYSMDRGQNENNQTIYYSIPKTGGNIWFDGWVLPKGSNVEASEAFVDFLSDPEIASENMDYIGYTSFIAGDTILNMLREWYDPRSYATYVWHDATLDGSEYTWEDSWFLEDEKGNYVYQDGSGVHEDGDDYGSFDMTGSTYEMAKVNGMDMSWQAYQDLYNAQEGLGEDEQIAWDVRNLTYMFEGTLSGDLLADYPTILGDNPDENPYLFYTDELEEISDPSGTGPSVSVGRQFYTQYPDQTLIPKLAIMKDYGDNNKYVLTLWENVKSDSLPIWAIVTFSLIIGLALVGGGCYFLSKHRNKKIRKKRREEDKSLS